MTESLTVLTIALCAAFVVGSLVAYHVSCKDEFEGF